MRQGDVMDRAHHAILGNWKTWKSFGCLAGTETLFLIDQIKALSNGILARRVFISSRSRLAPFSSHFTHALLPLGRPHPPATG